MAALEGLGMIDNNILNLAEQYIEVVQVALQLESDYFSERTEGVVASMNEAMING